MRNSLIASLAVLLIAGGSPLVAQQAPERDASGAPLPPREPRPSSTEEELNKLRPLVDQFLDAVTRPPPPPRGDVPVAAPVPASPRGDVPVAAPAPAPPPPPRRASPPTVTTPPAVPRDSRPIADPVALPRPLPPAAAPDLAPAPAPAPVAEAAIRLPAPAPSPPPTTQPEVAAASPAPPPERPTPWLAILAVVAALAAAGAAGMQWRRHRLVAHTRAMLSLAPSLDPAAGSCSAEGLSLAGPAVAIRSRLDFGPQRLG